MDLVNEINEIVHEAWAERDAAEREVAALNGDVAALIGEVLAIKKEKEGLRTRLALTLTSGVVRIYRPPKTEIKASVEVASAEVASAEGVSQGYKKFLYYYVIVIVIVIVIIVSVSSL